MEIIPTFIQTTASVEDVVATVFVCCLVWMAARAIIPVAGRLSFRLDVRALLSAISLPGLAGHAALVDPAPLFRNAPTPHLDRSKSSPALYERVPPPRSLVRAGDIRRGVHPAIHGPGRSAHEALFPRAEKTSRELEPWERGAIDLRRTTRRGSEHHNPTREPDHYTVLPGDTLWDITAKVLRTDDQRVIARCWPKLHRANVDVIGRDPNLIRPGQVLYIPRMEDV